MGALLSFRPWNPRTWSTFPMLSAFLILHSLVFYTQLKSNFHNNNNQLISATKTSHQVNINPVIIDQTSNNQTNSYNYFFSLTLSNASFILIIILSCIKLKSLINERYERHEIFNKGNVPSIPNKNPISGNLFELIVPNNNLMIQQKYHEKLGKTYGMFYGPDPWILTIDVDLLQKVFTNEYNRTEFRMPFITEFSKSVAQSQDENWKKQRKTLNPFFTCHQMKKDNVFDDIDKACAKFIESIRLKNPSEEEQQEQQQQQQQQEVNNDNNINQTKSVNTDGYIIDINYQFKKFSLEVIFQVAYGYENGIDMRPNVRNELIDYIEAGAYEIRSPIVWACIMFDNLERFIGQLAKFTKIGKYIKYIHKILDISLDNRREKSHLITTNDRKMIDTIIECIDQNKMNYESVRSNLFFLLLAGSETTANTLTVLFWLLAKHPKIQEKLRESILIDADQSKYLEWTLMETLRLYPAVPSGVGRILSEDIEHNGMKLFKGTTISASIYVLHREQGLWGPIDANEFNPDRFEQLKLHPAQYFAFGFGARYCIGTNLAMAELRAITTRILAKFRIESCSMTPDRIKSISPNIIHMILEGEINVKFVELSCV